MGRLASALDVRGLTFPSTYNNSKLYNMNDNLSKSPLCLSNKVGYIMRYIRMPFMICIIFGLTAPIAEVSQIPPY